MRRRSAQLRLLVLLSLSALTGFVCAQVLPTDTRLVILEASVVVAAEEKAGSGTIISEDGFLFTNFHVVGDMVTGAYEEWLVIYTIDPRRPFEEAEPRYWARFISGEPEADVALLKIEYTYDRQRLPASTRFTHVTIGDAMDLVPGDPLWAFGYPNLGGYTITVTGGVMSGWLAEDLVSGGRAYIKSDIELSPGNSGGGAFDAQGKLVGISTAYTAREVNEETKHRKDISLLRPVEIALPLLQTRAALDARTAVAPPTPTVPETTPEGGTVTSRALACSGIERLHVVSATGLQIRNTLRLQQERISTGPHWTSGSLFYDTIDGFESFRFFAVDAEARGSYFVGLAVNPRFNFLTSEGDTATVLFSCVERLDAASLAGAFDFSHAVLGLLADTGVELLDRTVFLDRFPGVLETFPPDACLDWPCTNLLGVLPAPPVAAGPAQAGDDPADDGAAAEGEEQSAATVLWAGEAKTGDVVSLVVPVTGAERPLTVEVTLREVELLETQAVLTLGLEASNGSGCPVDLRVDLVNVADGDRPLGGLSAPRLTLAAGARMSSDVVVWTATSTGAIHVGAVPVVTVGECRAEPAPAPAPRAGAKPDVPPSTKLVVVSTTADLIAATRNADVIVVRPGTYRLTEELVIARSVQVIGSGAGTTIIEGGSGPSVVTISSSGEALDVALRDLTIRQTGSGTRDALTVDGFAHGTVDLYGLVLEGASASGGLDETVSAMGFGLMYDAGGAGLRVGPPTEPSRLAPDHRRVITLAFSEVKGNARSAVAAVLFGGDSLSLLGNAMSDPGSVVGGVYDGSLNLVALPTRDRPAPELWIERNHFDFTYPIRVELGHFNVRNEPSRVGVMGRMADNVIEWDTSKYRWPMNVLVSVMAPYRWSQIGWGLEVNDNELTPNQPLGFDECAVFVAVIHSEAGETEALEMCNSEWARISGPDFVIPASGNTIARIASRSGRAEQDRRPAVDIDALIAELLPEPEPEPEPEVAEEDPGPPGGEAEESRPQQVVFSRAPYVPNEAMLASVRLSTPPEAESAVEDAQPSGACGPLQPVFAALPAFGDAHLDAVRERYAALDGCAVIADALAAGETHAGLAARMATVAAEAGVTMVDAETCVAAQAARSGVDGDDAVDRVYQGTFDYGAAGILTASCARAAVESLLTKVHAEEVARQASSFAR